MKIEHVPNVLTRAVVTRRLFLQVLSTSGSHAKKKP